MQDTELEGQLDTIPFGDLVQLLGSGRKNGTLELTRKGERVRMVFRDGNLAAALIGDDSVDPIRAAVEGSKLLSPDEVRSLTRLANKRGESFGQTALSLRLVTPESLEGSIHETCREAFANVFDWGAGAFTFRPSTPQEDLRLPSFIPIQELLMSCVM